jgi:hypothetical protein
VPDVTDDALADALLAVLHWLVEDDDVNVRSDAANARLEQVAAILRTATADVSVRAVLDRRVAAFDSDAPRSYLAWVFDESGAR